MKVIAIKSINNRLIVEFDNNLKLSLSIKSISDFALEKGKVIDNRLFKQIIEYELKAKLLSKTIEFTYIRPRSILEAIEYLEKNIDKNIKNYEYILKSIFEENIDKEKLINEIIIYLKEKEYLNDGKFAKWWIQNRLDFKNISKKELEFELLRKGVGKEAITHELNKIYKEDMEINSIQTILNKKYKNININELNLKERNKVISYLLRKGYNYELIKSVLKINDY